jgi:hypothetical protein
MIMFPTKTLLTITTLLCLPVATPAQRVIAPPPSGLTLQPTLPNYQSSSGAYDLPLGNTWLGATVHAEASMTRQLTSTIFGATVNWPTASQHLGVNAVASLLGSSREVLDFLGNATSSIASNGQTRLGQVRIALAGNTVVNQSFLATYTLPSTSSSFNVFPSPASGSVPLVKVWLLGTISVKVEGNVACTHARNGTWTLPAGKADATVAAASALHANADAWIGAGVSGVSSASVSILGKVIDQWVSANATASATSGFSGSALHVMNPLQAAFAVSGTYLGRRYVISLASWSLPAETHTLM